MDQLRVAAASEREPVHPESLSASARRRVLVVDDEHAVRRVVAETLRRGGYEVVTAADGDEALLALETHPDLALVITDMVMPGRDGAQVARDAEARLPGVPVLVISGHVRCELAREAILGGQFAFLHKPFRPSELLDVVTELLANASQNGGWSA